MITPEQKKLAQVFLLTAESFGTQLSQQRVELLLSDLAAYSSDEITESLGKCRRECKFFPTLSEILTRISSSFPSADEAWALIPHDDVGSYPVFSEQIESFGEVAELYDSGDRAAARVAFKNIYEKRISAAADTRKRPLWWLSSGTDKKARLDAAKDGLQRGRLLLSHLLVQLPEHATALVAVATAAQKQEALQSQAGRLALEEAQREKLAPWEGEFDLAEFEHVKKGAEASAILLKKANGDERLATRMGLKLIRQQCEAKVKEINLVNKCK
jgi:hypothetical protein